MNILEGVLPEISDVVIGTKPTDLAAAASVGRWFNMANVDSVNCLLIAALGGATEDPVLSLEQATDSAGTGAKALSIYRVDIKQGATGFTAATDLWTKVATINRDLPAASYTYTGSALNEKLVNIFVRDTDLDLNNGFRFIRVKCADVGVTAQLGTLLYIPIARKYAGKPNVSFLA